MFVISLIPPRLPRKAGTQLQWTIYYRCDPL